MRLRQDFYQRDVLEVAPDLLGKVLVRKITDTQDLRGIITEVEAYRGEEDKACHAKAGKTNRTKVMYEAGGKIYMYFIYGMYWMLNIVTAQKDIPQAVLVRGVWVPKNQEGIGSRSKNVIFGIGKRLDGPGKVTSYFGLNKSHYGLSLVEGDDVWLEDVGLGSFEFTTAPRINISYAGEWAQKPWRWVMQAEK